MASKIEFKKDRNLFMYLFIEVPTKVYKMKKMVTKEKRESKGEENIQSGRKKIWWKEREKKEAEIKISRKEKKERKKTKKKRWRKRKYWRKGKRKN